MGGAAGRERQDSLIVEVDTENEDKDLDALDIALPKLPAASIANSRTSTSSTRRPSAMQKLPLKPFTPEETREIVFKTMLDSEIHHTMHLDGSGPADYRSVVAFFARQLLKDLRLVGGYDVLYPKVKTFMRDLPVRRAGRPEDPVVLRNLSEPEAGKLLFDVSAPRSTRLTIRDSGTSRIEDHIRLRDTRPFRTEPRVLPAKTSIFNRIVGEAKPDGFELDVRRFLDARPTCRRSARTTWRSVSSSTT